MWCRFALSRVLREWNGAETHCCTCKNKNKSPQSRKSSNPTDQKELRRQKNLGKVEEKKSQRKPFREWEELHTLS
jgi:hypothetical protein